MPLDSLSNPKPASKPSQDGKKPTSSLQKKKLHSVKHNATNLEFELPKKPGRRPLGRPGQRKPGARVKARTAVVNPVRKPKPLVVSNKTPKTPTSNKPVLKKPSTSTPINQNNQKNIPSVSGDDPSKNTLRTAQSADSSNKSSNFKKPSLNKSRSEKVLARTGPLNSSKPASVSRKPGLTKKVTVATETSQEKSLPNSRPTRKKPNLRTNTTRANPVKKPAIKRSISARSFGQVKKPSESSSPTRSPRKTVGIKPIKKPSNKPFNAPKPIKSSKKPGLNSPQSSLSSNDVSKNTPTDAPSEKSSTSSPSSPSQTGKGFKSSPKQSSTHSETISTLKNSENSTVSEIPTSLVNNRNSIFQATKTSTSSSNKTSSLPKPSGKPRPRKPYSRPNHQKSKTFGAGKAIMNSENELSLFSNQKNDNFTLSKKSSPQSSKKSFESIAKVNKTFKPVNSTPDKPTPKKSFDPFSYSVFKNMSPENRQKWYIERATAKGNVHPPKVFMTTKTLKVLHELDLERIDQLETVIGLTCRIVPLLIQVVEQRGLHGLEQSMIYLYRIPKNQRSKYVEKFSKQVFIQSQKLVSQKDQNIQENTSPDIDKTASIASNKSLGKTIHKSSPKNSPNTSTHSITPVSIQSQADSSKKPNSNPNRVTITETNISLTVFDQFDPSKYSQPYSDLCETLNRLTSNINHLERCLYSEETHFLRLQHQVRSIKNYLQKPQGLTAIGLSAASEGLTESSKDPADDQTEQEEDSFIVTDNSWQNQMDYDVSYGF